MNPQIKGIDRIECVAGITCSYQAHNADVSMAGNNPPQCHAADGDLPEAQDQDQDVTMMDAAGDDAPDGGQEQDSQAVQELLPNPEALVPGQQEG